MLATFLSFVASNNVQYTLADATSPVIGISFLLIMLRLALDKQGATVVSNNTISQRGPSSNYPLRSINVNVAQSVDIDSDLEAKGAGRPSYGDIP